MRLLTVIGLSILLYSCASTTSNSYTQAVNSWQGGNVNSLVARWGVPYTTMTGPTGNKILAYRTNSFGGNNPTTTPAVAVHYDAKGRPVLVSQPNTSINWSRGPGFSCMAIFEANPKGTIVSAQAQGNGCYGGQGFLRQMGNPAVKGA